MTTTREHYGIPTLTITRGGAAIVRAVCDACAWEGPDHDATTRPNAAWRAADADAAGHVRRESSAGA